MMDTPKTSTHSSLNLFSKSEVLVTVDKAFEKETLPVTSSNAPLVEFYALTTDLKFYLDLRNIEPKLETNTNKGPNGNTNLETEVVDAATVPIAVDKVAFTNSTLHSLFTNCEGLINKEYVRTSNNLYAHPAFT